MIISLPRKAQELNLSNNVLEHEEFHFGSFISNV
jgi:hypothetical protein